MSRPVNPAVHKRKNVGVASSAPASANAANDSTMATEYDSASDSSELSESSEEPSSESSSEDEDDDAELDEPKGTNGIINVRPGQGKKPVMKFNQDQLGPDIRIFLKEFLPQLKAANDELQTQREAGKLKSREIEMADAEEGEPYIEMDLGLGVLEAKNPNADESSESDSDEEMHDGDDEKDVLGKLMGRSGPKPAVGIQELRETKVS